MSWQKYLHEQPEQVQELLYERMFIHWAPTFQDSQQKVHQHILHQIHFALTKTKIEKSVSILLGSERTEKTLAGLHIHITRPYQFYVLALGVFQSSLLNGLTTAYHDLNVSLWRFAGAFVEQCWFILKHRHICRHQISKIQNTAMLYMDYSPKLDSNRAASLIERSLTFTSCMVTKIADILSGFSRRQKIDPWKMNRYCIFKWIDINCWICWIFSTQPFLVL